jgi:hypothetical protein
LSDEARKFIEGQAERANKQFDPKMKPPRYDETKKAGEKAAAGQPTPSAGKPSAGKPGQIKTYGDLLLEKLRIEQLAKGMRGRFEKYLQPVAEAARDLEGVLSNILLPNSRFRRIGWFKRGRPDMRRVVRAVHRGFRNKSDLKMFTKPLVPTRRRHAVGLVVDQSGSMAGQKAEASKKAVAMLTHALRNLEIPLAAYGFSEGVSRYLGYDETLEDRQKDDLMQSIQMGFDAGGGTNDVGAVAVAARDIDGVEAEQKILFVLTDGEGTHGPLAPALEEAQKKGVLVVGIGLGEGTESVAANYPMGIHVKNPEDLPARLQELLEELIGEDESVLGSDAMRLFTPEGQATGGISWLLWRILFRPFGLSWPEYRTKAWWVETAAVLTGSLGGALGFWLAGGMTEPFLPVLRAAVLVGWGTFALFHVADIVYFSVFKLLGRDAGRAPPVRPWLNFLAASVVAIPSAGLGFLSLPPSGLLILMMVLPFVIHGLVNLKLHSPSPSPSPKRRGD